MGWSFLRRQALSNEKAVSRYAQRRVVMETGTYLLPPQTGNASSNLAA